MSARQAESVISLLDAGLRVLNEVGYAELSLRTVARRAGVTHTTAYTYFASKDHLVAEIFNSQLTAIPNSAINDTLPLTERLVQALQGASLLLADHGPLSRASLAVMVSDDPDVQRIRDVIGADLR